MTQLQLHDVHVITLTLIYSQHIRLTCLKPCAVMMGTHVSDVTTLKGVWLFINMGFFVSVMEMIMNSKSGICVSVSRGQYAQL